MQAAAQVARPVESSPDPSVSVRVPAFEDVYEDHFDFVWRSLRRLGVPEAMAEDAAHDVFVVVHRRLMDFEGRSSVKTWLFGIAMRVARQHYHRALRDRTQPLPDHLADPSGRSPQDEAQRSEALDVLHALLAELPEDRRAVFILAELEQMSAPEIAEATGLKLNTVYSRLRLARGEFNAAVQRHRARDSWRQP
jgi:RNA polymerase sigma-70 factor (ECF subfamily)